MFATSQKKLDIRAAQMIDRASSPDDARVATMAIMLAQFKRKRSCGVNQAVAEDTFQRVRPLLQRFGDSADQALNQLRNNIQTADDKFKHDILNVRDITLRRLGGLAMVGIAAGGLVGVFLGAVLLCPPVIAALVAVGLFAMPLLVGLVEARIQKPLERMCNRLARELVAEPQSRVGIDTSEPTKAAF